VLMPMVVSPNPKTAGLDKHRTFLGRSRRTRENASSGHTACDEITSLICGMRMICVSVIIRRRDEICCLNRDSKVGGAFGMSKLPLCISGCASSRNGPIYCQHMIEMDIQE
jgi:hypothetical protein